METFARPNGLHTEAHVTVSTGALNILWRGIKRALAALKNLSERGAPEQPFRLLLEQAEVFGQASARGTIKVNFYIVNFTKASIDIDHIEVEDIRVGGQYARAPTQLLRATGRAAQRAVGSGVFYLELTGDDLHEVARGIDNAETPKSSPRSSFSASGVCVVTQGKRTHRVRFLFQRNVAATWFPKQID
jgi:hypothetical protein